MPIHTRRRSTPLRRRALLSGALVAGVGLSACSPQAPTEVMPERFVDPPYLAEDMDAQEQAEAEEAWEQISGWALDNATSEGALDPERPTTAADLTEPVVRQMTPRSAKAWERHVEADLAGDLDARDTVNLLHFHEWPKNFNRRRMEPVHHGSWVTDGEVYPAEGEGFDISMTVVTRAGLTWDKQLVSQDVNRRVNLRVVPEGDRWLVANYDGKLRITPSAKDVSPNV
ncbi:hypothetical protein SAMN05445756_0676 [Kytococcus aerolatus]|uniref:Lipoprotein n=1 Tax=Kytococcus aerolatus TaxID=592308 RepID=A0A212T8H2_9MICO|nr:hypothetical protein [Kytococcus aerolatus]SNC62357.1 hypothetical protein SAMN05445756_0676 [Kytococcus aerolatus]